MDKTDTYTIVNGVPAYAVGTLKARNRRFAKLDKPRDHSTRNHTGIVHTPYKGRSALWLANKAIETCERRYDAVQQSTLYSGPISKRMQRLATRSLPV